MPEEEARPGNRRFYRRIRNDQWQDKAARTLQDIVFHVRNDVEGLSVFDAAIARPRTVLEHLLAEWSKTAEDVSLPLDKQKWARRKLNQCGNSVEGLLAQGWGVAEVPEELFLRCGLEPSVKMDPNGHLEILGTQEQFEEQSLEIIDDDECRVLSDDECRA